ncbi:iron-sulfur cluster assembly protein, partial [Halorubrum pallidum]
MNESDVRERLATVQDPDLGDDIVSLGLVNDIDIEAEANVVRISLALGAPFSPHESAIAGDVRDALAD